MRTIFKYSLITLGALLLLSMSGPVREYKVLPKKQYSKTIEKNFPISKKGTVAIINKYGNIDMHTWERSEVSFKIKIKVNATSESVAEDVFETISIRFEDTPNRVLAETEIENKGDYWWNWGKNMKSDFEILYEVYMPITCMADFANKYGNVDMMDLENDAMLDIQYGNLTMGDLEGNLSLILAYGNGYVGTIKDLETEIRYSKFRLDYAGNFNGTTKYSELVVNRAEKLQTESSYDQYQLGKIREIVNEGKYDNIIVEECRDFSIETRYTDVKIHTLQRSLNAEMNYGGIRIEDLTKGFERIFMESRYAGLQLQPEAAAAYELELTSRYVDVNIPENMYKKSKKDGIEQNIQASINGGGKSLIRLDMEYGFLTIK